MRFLIVDEMHPSILPLLADLGIEADYEPGIDYRQAKSVIRQYEGLIIRSKFFVDAGFLQAAPRLQLIARAGSGLDNIDLVAARRQNIHIINAPEGNRDAVAEHVIGMLLALMNKVCWANREIRQWIWQREANRGEEIRGKTVAIIGYGNTGRALAKKLSGFECRVLCYDHKLTAYADKYAMEVSMDEIWDQADIVSIHLPLTEKTRRLVDYDYLKRFRKPVYFVNSARGEIVVLRDLLKALQEGIVRGACLDVLECEKFERLTEEQKQTLEALFALPQVLFTPHVAGWTRESYVRINEALVKKIRMFLQQSNQ
ncbi:NAD(P)-dependent oxidoreductase [Thermonema rossianum]|uniref:NAD(P)-dependent oxidoreductase n=1 Tax=Thermonema rossianum TaxID=55505 RepID=UPI0005708ABE|nr:NAD(P)-dependent oxidoreductase [Thermonema rossianum]